MKTIVTPLDGSPLAEQALPYVRLLAPTLGARVVLLRVVTEEEQQRLVAKYAAERSSRPPGETDWERERRALDELERRAGAYLQEIGDKLREAGLDVATAAPVGLAAECIVEAAA